MTDRADLVVQAILQLRRYARALTRDTQQADDLVQDALERAWRGIGSWRGVDDIRPWLFRILHNVYVNDLRRRRRQPVLVPWAAGCPEPADSTLAGTRFTARDLQAGLEALQEEQRQVLLLVGIEEFTYEEAAAILSIPVGTVMSRLFRARRHLRAILQTSETQE